MQSDPLYPDRSLPALFERSVRAHPYRVAVSSGRGELTFGALNLFANRLAHRLLAAGGRPGDRVALLMAQDLPSFASMLAVLKAGRVLLVLNPADPPARLRELVGDAEPSAVLADRDNADAANSIAGGQARVILVDDDLSGLPTDNPAQLTERNDPAQLVYTSGTTGRPKGVMQSHGQIMRNAFGRMQRTDVTGEDRVILVASLWGGQGSNTAFMTLLTGAHLVSFPASVNGVTGLAEAMVRRRITIYGSSASLFRHFMKSIADTIVFPDVRLVRLSSEPASSDDFAAFCRHFPNARLLSAAGMTEVGTIGVMELSRTDKVAPGRLPIGKPGAGVALRVIDEFGCDVPRGAVGTVVLSARHIALGYWRDPALTARHFAVTPDGMQLFHSGDLGRIDESGMLVLAGRKDATAKIRGQQVDLSEVQRALSELPGVAAAAAATVARPNGELQLVAYVVQTADGTLSERRLRALARAAMPRHLVPSSFVFIEAMPLSAGGKPDLTRLRAMAPPPQLPAAQPPAGDVEARLARIWEDAFECDGIGRSHDFFELGGNSLVAVVIAAHVYDALGVELHFGHFVDHPQLSAMARYIEERRGTAGNDDGIPLRATDRSRPLPLSLLQGWAWRAAFAPRSAARFTRASALRIEGWLDQDRLRLSVADVLKRHEILRTRFAVVDGTPMQLVEPPRDCELPIVDLSQATDAEERAAALLDSEVKHAFDIRVAPPIRFSLVRTGADVHWLIVSAHHIICDAQSWGILANDLAAAYRVRAEDDGSQPPLLPLQFGDFAVWQHETWRQESQKLRATLAWWRKEFEGGRAPTRFPLRSKSPGRPSTPSDWSIDWGLAPATSKQLDELGYSEGATFFMVRLAGVIPTLAALTGRDDAVVGGIFTGRNRLAYESLIGCLANLVTIGIGCDWLGSYRAFIAKVRGHVAALQANAEIPYQQLAEDLARGGFALKPLPVTVQVRVPRPPVHVAGLRLTRIGSAPQMPNGVFIGFDQFAEADNCRLTFDARLIEKAVMERLRDGLVAFFAVAAAEPDLSLAALVERAGIRPL